MRGWKVRNTILAVYPRQTFRKDLWVDFVLSKIADAKLLRNTFSFVVNGDHDIAIFFLWSICISQSTVLNLRRLKLCCWTILKFKVNSIKYIRNNSNIHYQKFMFHFSWKIYALIYNKLQYFFLEFFSCISKQDGKFSSNRTYSFIKYFHFRYKNFQIQRNHCTKKSVNLAKNIKDIYLKYPNFDETRQIDSKQYNKLP